LKRVNKLHSDILYPGQILKVLNRTDCTLNKELDEDVKDTGSNNSSKITLPKINDATEDIHLDVPIKSNSP